MMLTILVVTVSMALFIVAVFIIAMFVSILIFLIAVVSILTVISIRILMIVLPIATMLFIVPMLFIVTMRVAIAFIVVSIFIFIEFILHILFTLLMFVMAVFVFHLFFDVFIMAVFVLRSLFGVFIVLSIIVIMLLIVFATVTPTSPPVVLDQISAMTLWAGALCHRFDCRLACVLDAVWLCIVMRVESVVVCRHATVPAPTMPFAHSIAAHTFSARRLGYRVNFVRALFLLFGRFVLMKLACVDGVSRQQ